MTTCIIAEKPSVARDIARIVGADSKQEGYLASTPSADFQLMSLRKYPSYLVKSSKQKG